MKKFITTFLTLGGLLLSSTLASAATFDIYPLDSINEISPTGHAVIVYGVQNNTSTDPEIDNVQVGGPRDPKGPEDARNLLPHGVKQICGEAGEWCVQSCGNAILPEDPYNSAKVCQETFSLNYSAEESCKVYLCAEGEVIAEYGKVEGGPYLCTPRSNTSTCVKPRPGEELNISSIPPSELVDISIVKPRGREHLAVLRPGRTVDFVIKNNSSTNPANKILPTFTAEIAAQLESYDASSCTTVAPQAECTIKVTAKLAATRVPVQPVFFEGINTNQVEGHITITRTQGSSLKIEGGGVTFNNPDVLVDMEVKNTSPEEIRVRNIDFFEVFGVEAVKVVEGPEDCRIRNSEWIIPAYRTCSINVRANKDAYLPYRRPGEVVIRYTVGEVREVTQGTVVVVDINAVINNGNPIRLSQDNVTRVPVKNEGPFVWQDVEFFIEPGPSDIGFSAECPSRIEAAPASGSECTIVFEPHTGAIRGDEVLVGSGINGQAKQKIVLNEIKVVKANDRFQHLHYQTLSIVNSSDLSGDPIDVYLDKVKLSANLEGSVEECRARSSCIYKSTCRREAPVKPGRSCNIVLRSIDTGAPLSNTPGLVTVDVREDDTSNIVSTEFRLDKSVNLYATGQFNLSDTKTVSNIARWDGNEWFPLESFSGEGLSGPGRDLEIFRGDIVVVGDFPSAGLVAETGKIALWRGNHWSKLGFVNPNINGNLRSALRKDDDTLYVGGDFSTVAGVNVANIAQWTPYRRNGWNSLGGVSDNGTSGPVDVIAEFNNGIYFGGDFTNVTNQFFKFNNVAGWVNNITWKPLGTEFSDRNGTNNEVLALYPEGSDILVGGRFWRVRADQGRNRFGLFARHIAKWNSVDRKWQHVASARGDAEINQAVHDIIKFDNRVWIAGSFNGAFKYVARQEGRNWIQVGTGINGPVKDLYAYAGVVYAGGEFNGTIGNPYNNIASWNGSAWTPLAKGLSYNSGVAQVDSILITHSIHLDR